MDIHLYDVTLRDGNHALRHQLDPKFIEEYCIRADNSGVWAVEVGHGNGLGASSFLVGKSKNSDLELLSSAREILSKTKLAAHSIPGFSTIKKDLIPAINIGVDVFRVASHVTEANISGTHIEFLKNNDVIVQGVLMMSHMASISELIDQCKLLSNFGADAVILMDSAGNLDPTQVKERFEALRNEISIPMGMHAHNNLGVGIANALAARDAGAVYLDGATMALGAGAGNAHLESLAVHENRRNPEAYDLRTFFDLSDLVRESHAEFLPRNSSSSLASGDAGVFSGYAPMVAELSRVYDLDSYELWREIGRRNLVAGQESLLLEIAMEIKENEAIN